MPKERAYLRDLAARVFGIIDAGDSVVVLARKPEPGWVEGYLAHCFPETPTRVPAVVSEAQFAMAEAIAAWDPDAAIEAMRLLYPLATRLGCSDVEAVLSLDEMIAAIDAMSDHEILERCIDLTDLAA